VLVSDSLDASFLLYGSSLYGSSLKIAFIILCKSLYLFFIIYY